jgi:hypothetical protein
MRSTEGTSGSIGTPIMGVDLRICDDELRDVRSGESGDRDPVRDVMMATTTTDRPKRCGWLVPCR